MQRILTIAGPLPFLVLAMTAAGLAMGVAIFVYQSLSPCIADVTSWVRCMFNGVLRRVLGKSTQKKFAPDKDSIVVLTKPC